MDLDRDGRLDVLTGSYMPGEVWFFRGLAGGTLAAGDRLETRDEKPLIVGRASWPWATDWDRDGDLDLVLGNMFGAVFVARGSGPPLEFAAPQPLLVEGRALVLTTTNAAPYVTDWDGDGAADLLLGAGDGAVRFYRNGAASGEPTLGAPVFLIAPVEEGTPTATLERPGTRTRVAVGDWNGDGRADLFVGEHASADGPPRPRSSEEERLLAQSVQDGLALATERGQAEARAFPRWLEAKNIPPERASEHHDEFLLEWLATSEGAGLQRRQDDLTLLQRRLNPPLVERGRVWVYLRQPLAR